MNGGLAPRRDSTDPSYLRPLVVSQQRLEDYSKLGGGA
jgi:hypothetical protein